MPDATARLLMPFPEPGDPNDVPADLEAIAARIETLLAPPMTTAARDALTAAEAARIRTIWNSTTSKLQVYDSTAVAWLDLPGTTIGGAAPTTQAFGDVAAEGVNAAGARRDHLHGMPGIGGAAPAASAFGDAAVNGVSLLASPRDHKHAREAGVAFREGGTLRGTRPGLNLVAGTGIGVAGADNAGSSRVDYTLTNTAPWLAGSFQARRGNAAQSIPTGTLTTVVLDGQGSTAGDTSWASLNTGTGVVTISGGSLFLLLAQVRWASITTGIRRIEFLVNGLSGIHYKEDAAGNAPVNDFFAVVRPLSGQTIALAVQQSSGGAVDVQGDASNYAATSLTIVRLV